MSARAASGSCQEHPVVPAAHAVVRCTCFCVTTCSLSTAGTREYLSGPVKEYTLASATRAATTATVSSSVWHSLEVSKVLPEPSWGPWCAVEVLP